MEINKWDTKWIEQKAELEARLKAVFGCSSIALTLEGSIAGHEDPADPSKRERNLLDETPYFKHPLLTVLHLEMEEIASDASHNAQLNILLRIAIYSIAKVGILKFLSIHPNKMFAEPWVASCANRWSV